MFLLLPVYLLGNLHCLGMCGPLVAMIGRHRYRWWYFLGRTTSFSLAGLLAGGLGALVNVTRVPAAASFIFGGIIIVMGLAQLLRVKLPQLSLPTAWISKLMLKDRPETTFAFGFCTVLLPCGQTMMVFAACAVMGSASIGLFNGFLFALLTSPSLALAMQLHKILPFAKQYYAVIMGSLALLVGALSVARGFADLGTIPHIVLNQRLHIALY